MAIQDEDLAGKVILEVGSGRGDTTRQLVDLLSGKPGARLIVTDISDSFFSQLQEELQSKSVRIEFLCTGAQELQGIPNGSVDYIVCNYTLCTVNSQAGLAMLALRRFWEVLKAGGKLFVEEEFPIDQHSSPTQEVWSQKWRILKAGMLLVGQPIFNEISPVLLKSLSSLAGFEKTTWTAHTEQLNGNGVLNFFQKRLNGILKSMPNEHVRDGFMEMATGLEMEAARVGGMEIPFYRLVAQKTSA